MKKMLLFLGAVIAATAPALAETFSISNLDELREFMDAAHDSNFAGDTVLLTADIDCEGGLFNPGDPGYPPAFSGTFNGQGHTIRGICWTNGSFAATAALFGKVEGGAVIRDLTVVSGNVPGDQNTLCVAGLAASVGSDCLISNCHAVVDLQGVYPAGVDQNANPSCQFFGLARTVSGTDIRIVDCTAEGRLAGGTEACGFVGEAKLNGGEIARCAVFADVSTMTNRTGGSPRASRGGSILRAAQRCGNASRRASWTAGGRRAGSPNGSICAMAFPPFTTATRRRRSFAEGAKAPSETRRASPSNCATPTTAAG